jgi:hypothetical protein
MQTKESDVDRKQWLPMKIEEVGKLTETILTGGGKNSPGPADPGEVRKPPGQA